MSTVGLIVMLYAIGLLLVTLDVLVIPTHVVGVVGLCCVLVSLVMVFRNYPSHFGIGMVVLTLVIGVILAQVVVSRFTLRESQLAEAGYVATDPALQDLCGRQGVAATMLRPAGKATIDGKRVDVVTRGELLEADTPVLVIEVEGNRVVVRAQAADA